jgi:hypothetical protein
VSWLPTVLSVLPWWPGKPVASLRFHRAGCEDAREGATPGMTGQAGHGAAPNSIAGLSSGVSAGTETAAVLVIGPNPAWPWCSIPGL